MNHDRSTNTPSVFFEKSCCNSCVGLDKLRNLNFYQCDSICTSNAVENVGG